MQKSIYVWFDTKSNDSDMPKLLSITLATEGVEIAGERIYNFASGEWDNATANGSTSITLNFEGGKVLQSTNEGVMAAMVVLPAEVGGTNLTVTYTFEDESTFTEVKTPSKNFVSGATQRIATTIGKSDLKKEEPSKPEDNLPYELRVLTFEDKDVKFQPYYLEYADNFSPTDRLTGDSNAAADASANHFKISNAIDFECKPVDLKFIDFVKVQVGVNAKSGWLGEVSTEVFGFYDYNMKKNDTTNK